MALLSGWDSSLPGVPPKDLVDVPEDFEAPKGYFAKLEKHRSMARQSAPVSDMITPIPSLKRTSLDHAVSSPPDASGGGDILFRRSSMNSDHSKYHGTDWTSELNSLRPKTDLKSHSMHKDAAPSDAWWKRMDAGMMNDHLEADVDDHHAHHGSSYVPQFAVTGQGMNYGPSQPRPAEGTAH